MSNWDLKFHTITFKTYDFFLALEVKEGIVEEASYDFNTDTKNKQNLTNNTRQHSSLLRQKQNTDSSGIHI